MDFIELGVLIGTCFLSYKKGQEEGQKNMLEQLKTMQQQNEIDLLKKQIQELKNNLPPTL